MDQRPTPNTHTLLATTVATIKATPTATGVKVPRIPLLVNIANTQRAGVNAP